MSNMKYIMLKNESIKYGFKYPTYEKYINKETYYNKIHKNKYIKYLIKLTKSYPILTTDENYNTVPYVI